jgi:adenylate cyclase
MGVIFSCLLVLDQPERAKEWARRAVLIDPDNMTMRYNLACDLIVNLKDFDMALEMLAPVYRTSGREQIAWQKGDPDLDPIRDDPRFRAMIEEAEKRLAAEGR